MTEEVTNRSVLEPRGLRDERGPARLDPVVLRQKTVPLDVGERDRIWWRARADDLSGKDVRLAEERFGGQVS